MPLPKQQTSISQTQPSQKLRDYAVENESSSGSFTLQGGARPPGGPIGARPETCPEVRFHLKLPRSGLASANGFHLDESQRRSVLRARKGQRNLKPCFPIVQTVRVDEDLRNAPEPV